MLKNSAKQYGTVAKFFHWLIALGIIANYVMIYWREETPKEAPIHLTLILLHKSVGMTVLMLAVVFILWRLVNVKPEVTSNIPPLMRQIAVWVQRFMIFIMLAMPLTGYVMSMASGRTVVWFGLFDFPNFIAKNKALGGFAYSSHVYLSYFVIGLFVLHVGAALKHHFIAKDNVLRSMIPFGKPKE